MRVYQYTAIITKNIVILGKVTYACSKGMPPLDSRCISGYILGESPDDAKSNAMKRLKQQYPEEQGYIVPATCRVETVPEIVIEVI